MTVVLAVGAGTTWAADKEVKGTVVKVDVKNKTLTVKTDDGEKTYDVNDETKFFGPKGGPAEAGLDARIRLGHRRGSAGRRRGRVELRGARHRRQRLAAQHLVHLVAIDRLAFEQDLGDAV